MSLVANADLEQGEGDQKFVPDLTVKVLHKIATISPKAKDGLEKFIGPLLAVPPFSLGYPSKSAQSAYYPGPEPISQQEIAKVSEAMEQHSIGPENTRVRKLFAHGKPVYQLLQASAETGVSNSTSQELDDDIFVVKGDHVEELAKVCWALKNQRSMQVTTSKPNYCRITSNAFALEAWKLSQRRKRHG